MERFKNILVATSPGHLDPPTLRAAVDLAEINKARLTVVDVVAPIPAWRRKMNVEGRVIDVEAAILRDREERLRHLLGNTRGGSDVEVVETVGEPFIEVIRRVLDHAHDLVVVGVDQVELDAAPRVGVPQGGEAQFNYRMDWGVEPDLPDAPLRVLNTRMGARPPFGPDAKPGFIIAIDFEDGATVPDDLDTIEKLIRTSAGTVSDGVLQTNPETGGPRLAFAFEPGESTLAEFRVQLRLDGTPLSEVWLYRWTP